MVKISRIENWNMMNFTFKTNSGLNISGKLIVFPQKSERNFKNNCDFLFIPAFPFDSEMYVKNFEEPKFIKALNKFSLENGEIRIFLLDMPGFGESELFNSKPMDLLPYVESVNEIVNHFQIKKFIFGGCSMGGYIALEYMRDNPSIIEGLVLIDTKPYADNEEQKKNRFNTIKLIENSLEFYSENERSNINLKKLYERDSKVKYFIDSLYSRITSHITQKEKPKIAKQILNSIKNQKAFGIIHALNGMAGRSDTSIVLKNLKVKTLIIVGENDIVTPIEIAKQMKKMTANAVLEIIPSTGHLSNMENLFEFNQRLLKWLQI
ncbi:MAG: alpha/beta fold hydrolase [Candidatus Thorarchaeota archaeon]